MFSGEMGYGSYIGRNCNIEAKIGRFCSISHSVEIILGNHPSHTFVSTHPAFFSTNCQAGFTFCQEDLYEELSFADNQGHYVLIGNDVWIGQGAKILNGVSIGDGAIIAAGAVVTKDVMPYSIVGGVPAKLIRMRFDKTQIEALMQIEWWNRDLSWLKEKVHTFSDINKFINSCLEKY